MFRRIAPPVLALMLVTVGSFSSAAWPSSTITNDTGDVHMHHNHVAFAQSVPCWPFATPLGMMHATSPAASRRAQACLGNGAIRLL